MNSNQFVQSYIIKNALDEIIFEPIPYDEWTGKKKVAYMKNAQLRSVILQHGGVIMLIFIKSGVLKMILLNGLFYKQISFLLIILIWCLILFEVRCHPFVINHDGTHEQSWLYDMKFNPDWKEKGVQRGGNLKQLVARDM
jgi:hypothetical protein